MIDAGKEQSMSNPKTVSWTPPTTNTDGSPLAAGEVTGYQVGVRLTSTPQPAPTGAYPIMAPVDPANAVSDLLSEVTPPLQPGTYVAAVQTLSTTFGPSVWSVETAPFTILPSPMPPTNPIVA
jgi:hypothetical protein